MIRDPHFLELLDAVPVRLWCTDAAGSALYLNRAWHDFLGDSYVPKSPIERAFAPHPDDAPLTTQRFSRQLATREPIKLEFRLRRHDGAWRWMLCSGRPRTTDQGEYAGFIGSCIDVTAQRDAAARQQRELEERAAVMQELHHRVKNNAQVFASLLGVQANRSRDPAVKAALRAAAARASTMAIMQQQIWEAGSSARFDLIALIHRLVQTHQSGTVAIMLDLPRCLFVPLATAVPLGLILHELLANARDHAFPDGQPGQVRVAVARTGTTLSITVADDGVGMPKPGAGAHSSAGLTIVRSLVRQLDASLTTESRPGTRTALTMTCPAP